MGTITMDGATLGGVNITTEGGVITLGGAVTVDTGAVVIDATNGGGLAAGANVDFDSTVDGAQSLTVNSGTGGTVAFDGNIGDTAPVTSITITQSNGTTFSGDVAAGTLTITDTVDGQSVTFADAKDVDLTTGVTVSNSGADNYNIVINSSTFDAAGIPTS